MVVFVPWRCSSAAASWGCAVVGPRAKRLSPGASVPQQSASKQNPLAVWKVSTAPRAACYELSERAQASPRAEVV